MKTFGLICLMGILISCGNRPREEKHAECKSEEAIPVKIEIKKTNFYILTPYDIGCEEFEEWGDRMASFFVIEDKDTINQIVNIIDGIKRDTPCQSIDTRARLLIFYQNNRIDTICMDGGVISINGEIYPIDERLIEIIEKL